MAKLLGIAIKLAKRKPMQLLDKAVIAKKTGVDKDFRGKPGKRQVTVLDKTSWNQACEQIGKKLSWETRRANLLIDSLDLNETTGKYLIIGRAVLKIMQETDPCSRMDEAEAGLFEALRENWRGGVCCSVIEEGEVTIGDQVKLVSREEYETKCKQPSGSK